MREFLNEKSEKVYLYRKDNLEKVHNHIEDIKRLAENKNKIYQRKFLNCIAFGIGDTSYVFTLDPNFVYLVIDSNSKMDKELITKEELSKNLDFIKNLYSSTWNS